jgi:hypothetical protein
MTATWVPSAFGLTDPAGHFETVEVGKHHVEEDQVGPVALGRGESVPTNGQPFHLEAVVREPHRHEFGDVLLIVDDQNPRPANA